MSETHDYDTVSVRFGDLQPHCVLVGEAGGLSAVYGYPQPIFNGLVVIDTEHGGLVHHPDRTIEILAE